MLYFFLFLVTTAASQICDLNECIKVSNSDLQSGWNFSADLANIRAVELTGSLQDGCNLSFTSAEEDSSAEIGVEMYLNSLNINSIFNSKYKTYTVIGDYPIKMDKSIELTLQYLNGESDYFLQAFTNYTVLEKFHYTGLGDENYKESFVKLLKGFKLFIDAPVDPTRMLKSKGCKESLTVHLCPCIKPVIRSIEQSGTNLTCTAVSLDDLTLEWRNSTRNTSQPVTNATTIRQMNTRLFKSTLEGVEHPATYTCTAVLNSNPNVSVTMDYTIAPVIGPESQEKKLSKVRFLTFLAVAVAIITILGVSVWWFKFHKRNVSKVGTRNAVVELNASDVPDAEAAPRLRSETPIYASVSGMGRAPSALEDENVYNRLDKNMMTGGRDGFRTFRNSPVTGGTLHPTLNSSNPAVTGRTLHRNLYSNNPPPINPPALPTLPTMKFTLSKQVAEGSIYHETLNLNVNTFDHETLDFHL